MKILKLIGLGSDEENERSYFIFSLEEEFQKTFNEILEKIGLNERIYEEQLPLSDRKNEIDHFKNNDFDIDVIYTQNRIIVLVRSEKLNLKNFKELVLAYSKF